MNIVLLLLANRGYSLGPKKILKCLLLSGIYCPIGILSGGDIAGGDFVHGIMS